MKKVLLERIDWMDKAECREGVDPEEFFPDRSTINTTALAKSICARCVVRADCLETALENGEAFGVWGGLDEKERQQLVRIRRRRAY